MSGDVDDLMGGGEDAAQSGSSTGAAAYPTAVAGAEAVAAAIAMHEAGYGPGVAHAAERFLKSQEDVLRKQGHHIDLQNRQIEEENDLRMSLLRGQRLSQHLRIALQLFGAVVLAGVGFVVLTMVYDAASSRSVVVEPFATPASFAARGLTDRVVAGGVLDALIRLQSATRSTAERRNLANAWTSDIRVEVAQTGLSIGDIERILKARFGHDIHIEGDLVQTEAGGLALTIRGDGVLPKTFEGNAGDLGKLTAEAAEYAYGQSQPVLYASFLEQDGRSEEAIAFAKSAYATTSVADRPYLLNSWGIALLDNARWRDAETLFAAAVRMKPDFWAGYTNLMDVDLILGNEEGAWQMGERMREKAGGQPGRATEVDYENLDLVDWNLLPWRDAMVADLNAHAGVGANTTDATPQVADIEERLHDTEAAEVQLQVTGGGTDPTVQNISHFVRGRLASDAGDSARAAVEMETFEAHYFDPVVSANYPGYDCWVAPAEEAAGHPDKADAALKAGGHYVDCYRFRADILDHRGDWAGAQKAYAAAVAIAPDLPAAYYSWGLALVRHGNLAGAEAKLAAAHARGPNWADPLKALGDILARQGRWKDAQAKYDDALKDAPNWLALHFARDTAEKHPGQAE